MGGATTLMCGDFLVGLRFNGVGGCLWGDGGVVLIWYCWDGIFVRSSAWKKDYCKHCRVLQEIQGFVGYPNCFGVLMLKILLRCP